MFYTYILQSEKDLSYYIGYTSDIEERLKKHNNSTKGYTATKKPWKIVFLEEFQSKTAAIKRENEIKKKKSKTYIQTLIKNWSGSSVG